MFKKIISGGVFAVIVFLFISCPSSLSKSMVREVQDSVAPELTILSPENEDTYGAYTLVSGTVTDLSNNGGTGKISSLFIEVVGVTGKKSVPVNGDGSFSIILETNGAGYNNDIVMKLTATDWNGNTTEKTLALKKADGEITGFTVTAGNRSAEITWDPLPGASSYTVKEYPSQEVKEDITGTSYTWENLTNGNNYSFSVSAEIDGKTFLSSIIEIIPLSPLTLAPLVESVYRGVFLTWKDIPAASDYIVEKAQQMDGPYSFVTETEESHYLDKNLRRDARYYYRVYPVWGGQQYNPDVMRSVPTYGCAGYFHGRNDYSIFSSVDTDNSSFTVKVRGDYAYIADGTDGLWIADISDIYNPKIVSYCDTTSEDSEEGVGYNGNARGVALSADGSYAYIANNNTGMEIIDIENSSNPYQLRLDNDSHPFDYDTYTAHRIALFDQTISTKLNHYACIADDTAGMKIVNVTTAADPVQGYPDITTTNARSVFVKDGYIYLADSGSGVRIYETSGGDSLSVSQVGTCYKDSTTSNSQDVTVTVNASGDNKDYAYVAEKGNGFNIFDITTKSSPVFNINVPFNTLNMGDAFGVAVSGNRACVATRPGYLPGTPGLVVLDISHPDVTSGDDAPKVIGTCVTPGLSQSVTIYGDYALVPDFNSGLQIIDISNPNAGAPVPVSFSTNDATGIAVSGNYAFLSDGAGGMKIINIATPLSPVSAGSWSITDTLSDVTDNTTGVAVSGNYAYVTDYSLGLHVIDISNPSAPLLKATCDITVSTPGRSMGVALSGDYAYVAAKANGLQIVDISDPLHPKLAGLCATVADALGVAVSGDYAYVVCYDSNNGSFLIVMNISDPDHPYQVSSVPTTAAYGVAVSGHYAYVADGSDGLQIFNVTNPESPSLVGSCTTTITKAESVTISGSYAYVADGTDGLRVIDISDPENPVEITSAPTTDAEDVAVAGRYAYVADGSGGFKVVDLWKDLSTLP